MANRKNGGRGGRKPAPTRLKVASGTVQPCQINLNEPKAPAGAEVRRLSSSPTSSKAGRRSFETYRHGRWAGEKIKLIPWEREFLRHLNNSACPLAARATVSDRPPVPTARTRQRQWEGRARPRNPRRLAWEQTRSKVWQWAGRHSTKCRSFPWNPCPRSTILVVCRAAGAPGGSNVEATPAAFPRNAPTRTGCRVGRSGQKRESREDQEEVTRGNHQRQAGIPSRELNAGHQQTRAGGV